MDKAALDAVYSDAERERSRLFRRRDNRLEHLRTLELLARLLPESPARVLDVGGGPGTYAEWLAERGYDVHLIEPARALVEAAAMRAAAASHSFTTAPGDARDIDEPDASCDVVLLLGPLYHLLEATDRSLAMREAMRVVRPGGLVAAAGLTRACFAMFEAGTARDLDANGEAWRAAHAEGAHHPPLAFAPTYAHFPSELAQELELAGCTDVQVYGIEGPAWMGFVTDNQTYDDTDPQLQSALQLARFLELDQSTIGASAHMLAVGRKRTG